MINKILIFAFIFSNHLFAQHRINGKVIDATTKEALPFANITLKSSQKGTTTDENGLFSLEITNEDFDKSLLVSYIAYESATVHLEKGKAFYTILMKSNEALMSEVVVTGTMKEVSKMDSPVPIEVYTPTFFKRNPTPSLFTALENVNGVRPQLNCNVCNTGDIHINGMEGPYTMVMIDGMPIVSGLSTVYGLMGIPNSMIQRVEVVKGPASTLYGSEAVGGLINVITKTVENAPTLAADINYTSYQELNADLSAKAKIGKATTLFSGNIFNFDKKWDKNKDNFTDITLQKRASFFNKWNFQNADNQLTTIALRYIWENRWGGEMQWTPQYRGTDSIYAENILTNRFEVIGNHSLLKKEKLNLAYSYNYHHQNSVYGNTFYLANQQIAFTQLTWDKIINKHSFLLGATFRYTFYDDNSIITSDSLNTAINRPSKIYLPGIFVQDEIKINRKNKILLGIRYDYNWQHGNIFTPRLNYQWKPNDNNTVRIGFGNGYRIVNLFSEDHAALTGARQVEIREALLPERSYNTNINFTNRFFPSYGFVNIDASLFYTYFTNRIVADYFTDANKVIYDNLKGYSISKGLTINIENNFSNGLKIISGATLMRVFQVEKNDKDNYIQQNQIQTPPFSGTWTVSYTFPKWNVVLDYTGNVSSPMLLPILPNDFRPAKSPWFSLQNIQITKIFSNGIEIYGGIKNLLNFIPKHPIMRPFDPFDKHITINNPNNYTFDPSYNYAPIQGIRSFIGCRMTMK